MTRAVNTETEWAGSQQTRSGRLAWKILLGLALVIGLFGVGDVIVGFDADPGIPEGIAGMSPDQIREAHPLLGKLIDFQVRAGGLHLVVMAFLWMVILVIPYRRSEPWAWYVMWTFPLWSLGVAVSYLFIDLHPDAPPPPPAISGWVFFVLTATLLLITRRGSQPKH